MRFITITALAALAAGIMYSCQSSDCLDLRSAIPQAGFRAIDGTPVALDSLAIQGIGAVGDSLLLSPGTMASTVYLPLRAAIPSTTYIIRYAYEGLDSEEYNDTITITYESIPYFVSQECGASYRYRITDITYTRHFIESIECPDPLITNIDKEWLQIYLRVETPETPGTELSIAKGGDR